jgi:hypothetical protein
VAAWLFFFSGVLGIIAAVALPWFGQRPFLSFPILILGALISVPYSLFRYKQLERRGELEAPAESTD